MKRFRSKKRAHSALDDEAAPLFDEPTHGGGLVMPQAGVQSGRLARQDLGAVSLRLDDLEYALEGLTARRATIAVLRRSALDVIALLAERKQRSILFNAK